MLKINITYFQNTTFKEEYMENYKYNHYPNKNIDGSGEIMAGFLFFGVFLIFISYFYICYSQCRQERIRDQIRRERNEPLIIRHKLLTNQELLNEECVICLDKFELNEKITTLSCNHYYHYNCIKEWTQKERSCPLCRLNIV